MKIAVSGAGGLVGASLVPFLESRGDEVLRLVRASSVGENEVGWDPSSGISDTGPLEGVDGFVHLAGENIASGRWSAAKMERIRASRLQGTHALSENLAGLERKPSVLVCASAVGFYGDRGEERLDEESPSGDGFLAEVCRGWEEACEPARQAGIRVVNLRIGVILSSSGGALQKMLLPFRMGVGGNIGDGRQYMSWITLRDVVRALGHALDTESLTGPVNGVSPAPVTNAEFTKALGRALGRPTILPMPAFAARLALGKMAEELLLASIRVVPRRLEESGFRFEDPEIEPALKRLVG